MLAKQLIVVEAAVSMLSGIATAANVETVTGSGTIQTVTWSPSPPPKAITIPTGATVSLTAPGYLQINDYTLGTAGTPTIP